MCTFLSALFKVYQYRPIPTTIVMHILQTMFMDRDDGGWEVVIWGRGPRTQIREGGKPTSGLCIRLGERMSWVVCCCFILIMAAVQTDVSLSSQLWQRPFHIYGGLACNSLMGGKCFICVFGKFITVLYSERN